MRKRNGKVIGGLFSILFAVFCAFMKKFTKKDVVPPGMEACSHDNALLAAPAGVCAEWQAFYRRVFGLVTDFSEVWLPERRPGFSHLLLIPRGLTLKQVAGACCRKFEVHAYADNLDRDIYLCDPCPENGSYAVWLCDRPEAEERLDYGSLKVLHRAGVRGISLIERLVYELKHFNNTGQHPDVGDATLCGGSWHPDGLLVDVYWLESTLCVGREHPNFTCGSLFSRAEAA